MPAISSVRGVVPCSPALNRRSNKLAAAACGGVVGMPVVSFGIVAYVSLGVARVARAARAAVQAGNGAVACVRAASASGAGMLTAGVPQLEVQQRRQATGRGQDHQGRRRQRSQYCRPVVGTSRVPATMSGIRPK